MPGSWLRGKARRPWPPNRPSVDAPVSEPSKRFLTPQLPDGYFLLLTASGLVDARLSSDEVVLADPDTNTWVTQPREGSPRWFRIVRQEGNRIWNQDGSGAIHEQLMVPDNGDSAGDTSAGRDA